MPRRVSSLPVPGGAPTGAAMQALVGPLRAALDGSGPPLHPYAAPASPSPTHASPAPAPPAPTPTAPALPPHDAWDLPEDLAVVVGTSGSTGSPKLAMLTAPALAAAADATAVRLGGPGDWLLALPPQHIAGLQVLARALRWGTQVAPLWPAASTPSGESSRFTARTFVEATARARRGGAGRTYTSLVPTQLARLLADPPVDADGPDRASILRALLGYDAVLVGGAATHPPLLAAARAEGVAVVTTYGSSETCGGCVYDGAPLPGVLANLEPDGRILLGGPVLAAGYLGDPARTAQAFPVRGGLRWFRTDDLGRRDVATGRLVLEGRVDEAINTGGLKVQPGAVEAALREVLPPGWDAIVVGLPDPQWGQTVAAVVAAGPGTAPGVPRVVSGVPGAESGVSRTVADARDAVDVEAVRRALRDHLPAYAIPRRIETLTALPTRGIGKPDRAAAARLLAYGPVGDLSAGRPAWPGGGRSPAGRDEPDTMEV